MDELSNAIDEKIIKSKKRVQNHGEVFTSKRIVKKMLDLPRVREACLNLTATFLEPAAGEGAFLVEVLNRKMAMVGKRYSDDLTRYENYSLLALSTLYGIELLDDNAKKCAMNMYEAYYESYLQIARERGWKVKTKVLNSAKLIISKNIAQGNFLTKLSANGEPIVFSEWRAINLYKGNKIINVQRTEYTLLDILEGVEKENGEASAHLEQDEQIDMFDLFDDEEEGESRKKRMKYIPVKIYDVYKEEMEEVYG